MSGALTELLARAEKAEGPDRELDKALWYKLIFDPALAKQDDSYIKLVGTHQPRYTASLDASLALCERVLPGASVQISIYPRTDQCKVRVAGPDMSAKYNDNVRLSPPAALLAAMLRALIAGAPA